MKFVLHLVPSLKLIDRGGQQINLIDIGSGWRPLTLAVPVFRIGGPNGPDRLDRLLGPVQSRTFAGLGRPVCW